ncbi:hypothetical protein [Deminuibacter soli]|uniref:Uncharacterized protein n=1 Tax=Deminuibacter soli TaxID=2291815 RepID=A0A3E1NQX7_9BACT|nr:hypothetical protein [Deminuibacter soli]RFM30331.1 hypothetical protein DXN05_05065 [Deminuibacter soli]
MNAPLLNKVRRLTTTCNWLIFSQSIYLVWMFAELMNNGSNTPALMYAMVLVFLVVFFYKFKKSLRHFAFGNKDQEEAHLSSIFMFVALILFGVQLIMSVFIVTGKGQENVLAYIHEVQSGQLFSVTLGKAFLYFLLPMNTVGAGSQFFIRLYRLNKTQQAGFETNLQVTA